MAYARDCSKFTSKAYPGVRGIQVRHYLLVRSVKIVSISSPDPPAMNLLSSQYAKHVLSVQKPYLPAYITTHEATHTYTFWRPSISLSFSFFDQSTTWPISRESQETNISIWSYERWLLGLTQSYSVAYMLLMFVVKGSL